MSNKYIILKRNNTYFLIDKKQGYIIGTSQHKEVLTDWIKKGNHKIL